MTLTGILSGGPATEHGPNAEILNHGHLSRFTYNRPGEKPFFIRFRHRGHFLPNLMPGVHLSKEGNSQLVRASATDEQDARETLEHHYGGSIDRSQPVQIEKRQPVQIISGHRHTVVIWPAIPDAARTLGL